MKEIQGGKIEVDSQCNLEPNSAEFSGSAITGRFKTTVRSLFVSGMKKAGKRSDFFLNYVVQTGELQEERHDQVRNTELISDVTS
jgi:hypothetical protein